jgi:hypothetical protein
LLTARFAILSALLCLDDKFCPRGFRILFLQV